MEQKDKDDAEYFFILDDRTNIGKEPLPITTKEEADLMKRLLAMKNEFYKKK